MNVAIKINLLYYDYNTKFVKFQYNALYIWIKFVVKFCNVMKNALCQSNSSGRGRFFISPRNSFQKEVWKRFVYVLHNIATKKSAFLL